MIREVAELTIDPERESDFLAAVEQAVPVFSSAQGCRAMSLERVVETPGCYRLIVLWDKLEDHTEGFRNSAGFQIWRGLAGPFFAQAPKVDHSAVVVTGFLR